MPTPILMTWSRREGGMIGITRRQRTGKSYFPSSFRFYRGFDSSLGRTAFFGVYKCYGPGSEAVKGTLWAKDLDEQTAKQFIAKSFVNGRHWLDPSDE